MTSTRSTAALATPERELPAVFALMVGAWCGALGFGVEALAWESHFFRERSLHVATAACLLALASRDLLARAARATLGARGPVVAWRAATAGALALAGYHVLRLDHMLTSPWSFFASFRDLWECEPEAFAVPVVVALAAYAGARTAVPSRARLRVGLALSALVAAALLGGQWRRAREVPPVHGYIASLPRLGALPPPAHPVSWDRDRQDEPSTAYTDYPMGGVTLRRFEFPHRGQCAVVRLAPGEPAPTSLPARYGLLRDCAGGVVRHDRARGLYVLSRREGEYGDVLPLEEPLRALSGDYPGRRMGELRDAFTVPAGWRWGSAALFAAGVALAASAARTRRARGRVATWRQGTLREDGTITLDGSTAVYTCPYGTTLAAGPVVLVGAPDAAAEGPFRGAPTPVERSALRPGLVADLVAANEAAADADEASATAAFTMAAAPLAAAAALGLLG